jgi:hypothetical protein
MQFGAKPLFENVNASSSANGYRYGLIGANGCGQIDLHEDPLPASSNRPPAMFR